MNFLNQRVTMLRQVLFPLEAGIFTLLIPRNTYQRQTDAKPHFSEVVFYETASTSPLFKLAEGGPRKLAQTL
jgi:hypothetical protein